MLSFETSLFAFAGVLAAAGPIVIHLLNRRRFRPIQWAAMDFLKQALERNKRILHLRDLILLALRVLAVLLFGLTLARPYYRGSAFGAIWHGSWLALGVLGLFGAAIWAVIAADTRQKKLTASAIAGVAALISLWNGTGLWKSTATDATIAGSRQQPVHAVLLVDNSRSLGVEDVGTLLLEQAKTKAREFLGNLPSESRMTVIPLAGSEEVFTLDAYRHREEMEKAVDRISLVDTTANLRRGLELALEAAKKVTELPTKRVVVLTDMQQGEFQDANWGELVEPLGGLQIVPVSASRPANVWLSSFELEDGLAGVEAPCRFLARLESSGGESTAAVLLRLSIDGNEVANQTVDLAPGQTREVEFIYQLDGGSDPERTNFALATLDLQSDQPADDQLTADNRRALVIPVVAALPVVFVDEYGDDEDLARNRVGETYALRHLLAPKTAGERDQRQLIRVIHLRPDQLTEEVLGTARLVVMAGVERPDFHVPLLREFVQQGGPAVILAGGKFDPVAWQTQAWLDGRGILPAPLKPEAYGVTPEEAPEKLQPFFADFASMNHDFFLIDQEDPEALAALFESTPFFKAIQADLAPATLSDLREADAKRLTEEQTFLAEYAARRLREESRSTNSPAEAAQKEEWERRYRELEPGWWLWRSALPLVDRSIAPAVLAERRQPHALAMFKGLDVPFVVDRRIGAGRVVLISTGVTSDWNLMRASGAMYVFHRIISGLIEETLPVRNYTAGARIIVPVPRQTDVKYVLNRPAGRPETLTIEALTADVSGVQIRSPLIGGAYRIVAEQTNRQDDEIAPKSKLDEWLFAVNGPNSESDLTRITPEELSRTIDRDDVRILGVNEAIDLAGGSRRGQGLWHACLLGVLFALLGEMALLSWPTLARKEAA